MNKRQLALIFTVLTTTSLVVGAEAEQAKSTSSKPNIVIVLTDDLGYGDVSFLNAESKVKTPHMDALAEAGVWAADAHSPSTVCSPSRYAMLTGRYAWRRKPVRAGRLNPWKESVILEHRVTLPKMLKAKGYATACIGKWHLGFEWPWKGGRETARVRHRWQYEYCTL